MFASLDHGDVLDNRVMVAGYVIMRSALVFLWWEVSRHDAERAPAARVYMWSIATAQVGWVVLAIVGLPVGASFVAITVLILYELAAPRRAERRAPTPWHPHHIAERYGLLVIITLGEVIIGTVASVNALVHGETGWSVEAALLAFAGVGLTFGCWWMYFSVPWAEPLVHHRERGFIFGYGHLFVFAALAAIGGGLHVAAFALEGECEIGATSDRDPERRDPGRGLRVPVLRPVLAAHGRVRPVPRRAARGHRGGGGPLGPARGGGRQHGPLPASCSCAPRS